MVDQQSDDTGALLNESAGRLFGSFDEKDIRAVEQGQCPEALWAKVQDAGFPLALVSEAAGGFGIASAEAISLLRFAGYHAAPVPLAETMLANRLLSGAGFDVAEGPATVIVAESGAFTLAKHGGNWRISGRAAGVPWARHAETIVLLAEDADRSFVVRLKRGVASVAPAMSFANLPADDVAVDAEIATDDVRPAPALWTHQSLKAAFAALRVSEMAGALARVMEITVGYANERVQFGKPIGKQQAIQQQLAVLAGQAAACGGAADVASAAFDGLDVIAIAAAKVRAGEAASIAAPIAHQVHGAIGFTEEHRLHFFTRRLWGWRDECGSERYWSRVVGQAAMTAGADGLWPFVVSVGAGQGA
ncbi:MAG: acyl-CoA dehydrogenase family protein [Xanthobacteraceae bacterium]